MILECIFPFGARVPGDQQVVPDGVGFDHSYFRELVPEDNPPKSPVTPVTPSVETDVNNEEPEKD